jgi:hypothetical protein
MARQDADPSKITIDDAFGEDPSKTSIDDAFGDEQPSTNIDDAFGVDPPAPEPKKDGTESEAFPDVPPSPPVRLPASETSDEGGYLPEPGVGNDNADEGGTSSYGNQILELLQAPRNLVNKGIDSAIAGDKKAIDNNGKHDARSLRANILEASGSSAKEKATLGYGADQKRGWRDDLNTVLFEPFAHNRDKAISDLGNRAADSAFDLSYELATDPLNYVSGILGAGGKAAKALGLASDAANTSKIANLGKGIAFGGALGAANDLSHEKDDNKPYIGTAEAATLGMAPGVVGAGFAALNTAGNTVVKKMLEGKTAEYMGKMVDLSQYPALKETVDTLKKKTDFAAHMIRQGYRKALNGLSDEEAVQVNQFMSNAKNLSNELSQGAYFEQAKSIVGDDAMSSFRAKAISNLESKYAGDEAREITEQMINTETADLALKTQDPSGSVKRYVWNQSRDIANKAIAKDPRLLEMSNGLSDKGLKSVEDWVSHNKAIKDAYNNAKGYEETFDPSIVNRSKGKMPLSPGASLGIQYVDPDKALKAIPTADKQAAFASENMFNIPTTSPSGNPMTTYVPKSNVPTFDKGGKIFLDPSDIEKMSKQPMTGLDYHTADVYDREAFEASKKLFSGEGQAGFKRGLYAGDSDAVKRMIAEGVPPREAYDRANSVYSDQAAKAFLDASEKEAMFIVNQGSKTFKDIPGVKPLDALTTAFKKKVLHLNTSWVKTNYWDNVLKVLTESGYINSAKYAFGGAFRRELSNDISKALENVPLHISSDEANRMIKLGVVDGNYVIEAKSLTDTEMALRYGKQKADNSFAGAINKVTDSYLSKPGIKQFANTTATLGQRFENNARIMTFKRLVKSGVPEGDAVKMVQESFYDYSKVTAFEKELAKRIIPFYSFTSKNLQYWPKALTDVHKVSRVNNALTAFRQLGSGAAERDPDIGNAIGDENSYLKNGYPQIANGDGDYTTLYSAPKMSVFDAIAGLTDPTKIAQGISPLFRVPAEMRFGTDLFSGQKINPDKNPNGRANWLPGTGYLGNLLNKTDPNFTAEFSLEDLVNDDSKQATMLEKSKRLLKGGVSAALGQTGVRANEKTGGPETTSSLPMIYSKVNEMIPFLPGLGGVGTIYNTINAPVMRNIYKSLDNILSDPDDAKTPAKGIDIPINYLAPFEVIRKDTNQLEKKQRNLEKD